MSSTLKNRASVLRAMSPILRERALVLRRWPRLISHLVAETFSRFTVQDAARAIIAYRENKPFYCELYLCMQKHSPGATFQDISEYMIERAFKMRRYHDVVLNNYLRARELLEETLKGRTLDFYA